MATFLLVLKFFAGLLGLFAVFTLIGHILHLDKYSDSDHQYDIKHQT